ncbi:MAG TPA: tRNA preQ1(34) S-adenosylmethionine ribosyltransferase-isomerase QueA [Sandaracinaceae bacterium LLY-WYZ-13_1]|nr:tRNA preQ1(34) S-adenosylmethionine ribosyltransferase-isomerase QueA [Sandaracinaceae bacterium LLY-WYZ-13_1]
MDVDELDYDLPEELIAQRPAAEREGARLLVLDRGSGVIDHRTVRELPGLLRPSLLVVNDTRVIPARLFGRKPTGGRVELLLVERLGPAGAVERWVALGRASKPLRPGTDLALEPADGGLSARVVARRPEGLEVELRAEGSVAEALERVGHVPLPPYVRRADDASDRERYQTVFARHPGAVAAPTAGLHFGEALVAALEAAGHRLARVTLHVGPGTFRPVQTERLEEHPMHTERYAVSAEAAAAIAAARREGRPVVAIGTTVVRTLESAFDDGAVRPGEGATDLFITPPFEFRAVDALWTNFHLPRSTLLALVMAFAGVEPTRRAYAEAVAARYRFFSYGDAMLIRDPGART